MTHTIHNVVRAIFDSYLTYRATDWGQKEFDPDALVKKEAKHKVSAVKVLTQDVPKYNSSTDELIAFLLKLADLDAAETASKNENLSRPLNLNLGWFVAKATGEYFIQTDAELAKAARAAMSAIVHLNKESSYFTSSLEEKRDELSNKKTELADRLESARKNKTVGKKAISDIEKELATTTKRYDALIAAMTSNYHEDYFKAVIKVRDSRGLDEKNFEDFCTNATNGTRKTPNLAKLNAGAAATKASEIHLTSIPEASVATSSAATYGGAAKQQRKSPREIKNTSTYSTRKLY